MASLCPRAHVLLKRAWLGGLGADFCSHLAQGKGAEEGNNVLGVGGVYRV